LKVLWHDGIGMPLYAKRLERGRFIWPSPDDSEALNAALRFMLTLHRCGDDLVER
jgi:transposase